MKIEEAITYAIMSDGHGKTTDQIAGAINRHGWHQRKDGKPALEKMHLISYDPVHHGYLELGGRVGNAFSDGKKLK